jgi:hypothetical protein
VNELVPFAFKIPAVKVAAPVPPEVTGIAVLKVTPLPNVLLVSVCESDVPTRSPAGAATVVNELVPFAFKTPAVKVAAPVPPEATGRLPEIPAERSTGAHEGAADPFDLRTYPAVPAASSAVAPDPVWYGTEPIAPPAIFVAVVAVVAVSALPVVDWFSVG